VTENFVIGVYSAPSQPGALSAFRFAEAVLSQNHTISQIFFYQEGILNALYVRPFVSLRVPLLACATALYHQNISLDQLAKGFEAGTLTQFFDALLKASRYIIFGN
jgi:sulfur relay (sulfurtransferase) complex TusBCD TusD component (DsrE family)